MAKKDNREIKIFSLNRIKYFELYQDALKYIKASYKAVGQKFNTASPFGQLLQVVLHLGRMIFYYIEDSISGLNISSAYRPDQVRGLAQLAGHDSGRSISGRAACHIYYVETGNTLYNGNICYIPNKTQVISKVNGLTYTILFGADNGKITMQSGNYLKANLIQGIIKTQTRTGTGQALQSYNFGERNYGEIDQYYINIYVNGEAWPIVGSLNDLGYNQKGCIVRTGINTGIDVFFGNGDMGMMPAEGSSIVAEYIMSDGSGSNLSKEYINTDDYWEIQGEGMLSDGMKIPLSQNFKLSLVTDVIFGTDSEDPALTQLIAPHTSHSFVLANETNYEYFFKKMNMFSYVNIIRGSYSINGTNVLEIAKQQAQENYNAAMNEYKTLVSYYGATSDLAIASKKNVDKTLSVYQYTCQKLADNSFQDNTIYIFLVPDITKRIMNGQNYFECDESVFYLSKDEEENIVNLINHSGQRIITVENKIVQPKLARFAINVDAKIWDTYDKADVYAAGLSALSKYFLNFNRKDIIPLSDIISIFENEVEGIDSVRVTFAADKNNQSIYGINGYYGIDEFGDITLKRKITDYNGQFMEIRDIIPLIRGGFTDINGVEYSNIQTMEGCSAFNLNIVGKSTNSRKTLTKYTSLT
ncbi:MAG: baseplate wedge subunit [Wendovervirus sonii]|uniref:Baseplate wedge subunit n=1 Tax=phage Lak_Megaphage_Sonny TaxID=3109229 RepID=A0ABZ0Z3S0_9CAUD|nr:MAG: baseplate wedge subunit [phage Lak_Megaphage_Sonny]